MWLSAESSGTISDDHTPSNIKIDLKSDTTSQRRENTVSTPMRLVRPKARTRENAKKRTHLPKKKAEVDESLGWLTAHSTDMKTRWDFHTDPATDVFGQMNEMEQDIM
ncbi:hypothetical protein L1987_15364 [Smallanthus sonchifolius]|uniref:Uncharacterized protein n=1 Tax=Smallanthus sonchifolius TaxID=185202 RepID=A0ACB9J5V8_9ASTR|nr:hypothetical protein L1987_15364 [Smallanthus sonchifolius]